jgi:hypothetical protein
MRKEYFKWALATCIAASIAACFGCKGGEGGAAQGMPKIAAAENAFDFGRVKQGLEIEHIFKIANQGNGDLIIKEAKGSRGFKAAVVTTGPIPPGGEGEVRATFKTKGRVGKTSGKITVVSNDSSNSRLVLDIEVEVFVDVAVKPRAISFGRIGKADKTAQELSITVAEPDKIKITSVSSDDPRFILTLKEGVPEGTAKYEVAFNGSDKIERITGKIVVKYEGSDVPSVDIPCTVTLVGDLRYPKSLYLNKREGVYEPREISLSSRSGKTVEVKRVEDEDKMLKTKIKTPKGQNAVVVVEVADPEASHNETERHILKIHTTDAEEPLVEIGYKITEKQISSSKSHSKKKRRSKRSDKKSEKK